MTGFHVALARKLVVLLQNGLAFADCDDLLIGGEWQQFSKSPDTAVVDGIQSCRPAAFEFRKRLWNRYGIPVIRDVQQAAALRACRKDLANIVSGRAIGMDTLLKCN